MSERLAVLLQYLLPKQALTALAGKFASASAGGLTTAVIRWFVGRYGVNMAEAANPDIAGYASFNEFFTRPLQAGARLGEKQRSRQAGEHRPGILAEGVVSHFVQRKDTSPQKPPYRAGRMRNLLRPPIR